MKCKACNEELEDGVTLCPRCGFENQTGTEDAPTEHLHEESVNKVEAAEAQIEQTTSIENKSDETEAQEAEDPQEQVSAEEETPIVEGKLTAGKITLLVVLAVAAIAVVAALVVGGFSGSPAETVPSDPTSTAPVETTEATIPADGNPDDVTCKGSYTVTDEDVATQSDAVVATLGEDKLTNGELQIYYWMQVYDFMEKYGQYGAAFGMNLMAPLDTQKSMDETLTWQQFFLREALNSWKNYKALSRKAQAEGFVMDEEYQKHLEELPANLEETAKQAGFETVDDMIRADMGPGATLQNYIDYMHDYYTGYLYYGSEMDKIQPSDADLEAYFDQHAQEYAEKGLKKDDSKTVDVCHILIKPEGGTTAEDGTVTYSEEEWAACEAAAQAVLDEYLAGEQTRERFAELATTYSQDPGSAANGGLYTGVYKGQMVPPFEEWSFDSSRQAGETGLVKTDYGYHIMYYVDSHLIWRNAAMQDMLVEKGNEFLKSIVEEKSSEIDYSAIALGLVDFAKK